MPGGPRDVRGRKGDDTTRFKVRVVMAVVFSSALLVSVLVAPDATRWTGKGADATSALAAMGPPPALTDTDPDSPANANSPRVKGTAQAGSTVRLYASPDCSGEAATTGSAAELASPGLQVSVPDDSTTTWRAVATDAAGNVSACSSSSITYVEDSTAPASPRLTDTDPDSPANQNSIRVKGKAGAKPWFLYLAPTAPHDPLAPEPRYQSAPLPPFEANPAFLESDRSDKPPFLARWAVDPAAIPAIRAAQLRMLMSVDDLVSQVFSALDDAGESNDTLAFFVSDNGYMWGEHGLKAKPWPYDHSAKIPFYMRWPARLGGGANDQRTVANVDLAPTVMDAAGLGQDPAMDGMSLLGSGSRDRILLESLFGASEVGLPLRTWASIRTPSHQYTEWYGDGDLTPDDQPVFREYYDLATDPWQLSNYLADSDPANNPSAETVAALHDQLESDLTCAGRDGLAGHPACGPPGSPAGLDPEERPNVLLIVTDDQRPTDTLDVMPQTKRLFEDQGIHFPNAFATTPLCCPGRASILTGRYAHNHGVKMAGYAPLIDQSPTIQERLQEAGYRTGIYGKYFSNWDLAKVPRHFDQWSVFNNGPYTNFKANEQGQVKAIAQYATGYVADKAAQFIRQQEDGSSTIKTYRAATTADCTPENLASTGSSADFDASGLEVSVPDDSATRFRATATDAAGNSSPCSYSSIVFNEDSVTPEAPELTDIDPDSPANHNSPRIKGTAEASATIRLYTDADCSGPATATGSAEELAFPGIEVPVPDNSITAIRATATDTAGNSSACSTSSITYVEDSIIHVEDSTAPAPPMLTDTDPESPANENSPKVKGTAEADSTVRLYTTADCSGAVAAIGSAEELESGGLRISVPDDSTTTVRATASDAFDNVSGCSSNSITYVEDSTAPFAPGLKDTDPDSPANHNSPRVKGTAQAGSTVRLYKAAGAGECTPANLVATGTAEQFASSGLAVSVTDNSATRFRATATDAAGNTSVGSDFFGNTFPCSLNSIVYTEDSTPPPGPTFSGTTPASPANNNSPKVKGTAQAGSTVRVYKAVTTAGCTAANLAATGTAAAFASPGLTVSVPNDSATRFRATATDAAGNASACSASSIVYREDSTAPPGPTFNGSDPPSPANNNSPKIRGTAQPGSTVRLYRAPTTADCTPARLAATGTATAFASPGLTVSVQNNSATRFRARATDAAGNSSVCSAGSFVYVEDSTLATPALARPPAANLLHRSRS